MGRPPKKTANLTLVVRQEVPEVERPGSSAWVTMSNALTRAGQGLSLAEKRLVAMGISKLDPTAVRKPGVARSTITAGEYAEAFEVDLDTAYNQLQAAGKELYQRSISFFMAAHRRNGEPVTITKTMRWVSTAEYAKKEGWISLTWNADLLPHLLGLKSQFTTYQLAQATALRSIYSWRLLELLMRFQSTGWAEYDIDDFCTSVEATAKQRENFAKIRSKIIEPAVRELQTKEGWDITWSPIKAGRRVKGLRFDFRRRQQLQLDLQP